MVRPATPTPAEVFHPSVYIEDEMAARGWDRDTLAYRMSSCSEDLAVNRLALDLYLDVGPREPGLRIGDAADLERAFGIDAAFFLELERRWLEGQGRS